ncbi:MAG: hypothetical protein M1444_01900, partial [Patescibacteria group bacterium]|nr:hypothetical protein [Patescibacteria group bacterium]
AIESEVRRSFEQDDQGNYVRITEGFELRKFSYKGREISVNNSPRDEKDEDSTIIKVLRTGDAFMKDERGAMLVFNNYADIKAFIKRLYEAGAEGQVLINIHGVTNSLRGKKFEAEHSASSTETSLLKFHIAFLGINLEIVLVPRDKHMDNKYKFGPAHREYQTRRILVDEAAEKQKKDGLDAQEPRSVYHILFSDDAKKDAGELLEELIENSRTATKMGLS